MKVQTLSRTYRHINVRPIAGALGAEIEGVDAAQPLAGEVIAEVRQALLDHLVVFLRNQSLTPQQQVAFARAFGEPIEYPQLKGLPECPLITPVVKLPHERVNFGGIWHSDTTYLPCPPMASMLYAIETPPYGGDTLFANQYLAYETLSEGLKRTLDQLTGISSSLKADASKTREDALRSAGAENKVLIAEHPVVRTHPETGRRALYVNVGHTAGFKGWTEEESKPLLEFLFRHQVKPEFTCRFQWEPGSLAFWDNRCAQHNPVNDYHGFKRVMHRVTLAGDRPV
jgi:taurine dioxygenase